MGIACLACARLQKDTKNEEKKNKSILAHDVPG
jgi:hypothetical protein